MTLPAFKAAGTGSETAPAWPTHASGDFGLLCVETSSGTVTTPSGWTLVGSVAASGVPTSLFVFYRFATSSSETAPSLAGGNNHLWGAIVTYTGVNTSTPVHGVAVQPQKTSADHTLPGSTTFLDDCMIVHACAYGADNAGPMSSGETNADLGSLTERYDAGTITGNGGGVVIIDGTKATAGRFRGTVVTMTSTGTAALTVALQAADKTIPTLGGKSRIVNAGM